MKVKRLFFYNGPVKSFDVTVNDDWYGYTWAVSERKAKANLAHQYKREHGLSADAKITLPGELELEAS